VAVRQRCEPRRWRLDEAPCGSLSARREG